MPRLTLRTLLAYIDDTLDPTETRSLGKKVAASEEAKQLVERIKKVTRRRGLATPEASDHGNTTADPNTVAEFLDNSLDSATLKEVEETCLESDVHLAEVAACHQILTLVLTEPVRVPPRAHRRMYQLVPAPAAVLGRRPSKTLPIGGAVPPSAAPTEPDDADAALLLGMKRYTATTWAARFALFVTAALLLGLLTTAAFRSLHVPGPEPEAPKVYAARSPVPSETPAGGVSATDPKSKEPAPKMPAPEVPPPKSVAPVAVAPPTVPAAAPDPKAKTQMPEKLPGPRDGDAVVGKVETLHTLVVRQEPKGNWVRVKVDPADGGEIPANAVVMALPGYKAVVLLDTKVQVLLWGNVPEQLPYRVFESRVKFHPPADGFDADLTLLGGRIYLKSKKVDAEAKSVPAKVRVRFAGEVWDLTLSDASADALVELVSWYEPGTLYPNEGKGGEKPRQEARVAAVSGAVGFQAPARLNKPPVSLPKDTQVSWVSKSRDGDSNVIGEPKPIENVAEALREPPIEGERGTAIAGLLTATAELVTRENIGAVLKNRLEPPKMAPGPDRDLLAPRLAIFAQAALADSTPVGDDQLRDLVDILGSERPWLSRQAVVTALTNWLARDVGNTALLRKILIEKSIPADQADRLLELLRGYISPTKPDPISLDRLLELLADESIPVREAALWNIMAVKLESWVPIPFGGNVGAVGAKTNTEEYQKFLTFWKGEVELLKKRPPKPKKP